MEYDVRTHIISYKKHNNSDENELQRRTMLILTDDEVLSRGLELVGFDETRQARLKKETKEELFMEHYGSMPFVYAQLWEGLQLTDD